MFAIGKNNQSWLRTFCAAAASGSVASVLSTIVLVAAGRRETGHPAAATNATSQWIWGKRATRRDRPTLRYTATGYTIHHLASIFWAALFERCFGWRAKSFNVQQVIGASAAVATVAAVVDFGLTPERFTPGFEHRLSKKSLVAVYAAFATGLAVTALSRR